MWRLTHWNYVAYRVPELPAAEQRLQGSPAMGKKRRTEQSTHDGDLCSNFAARRERERERGCGTMVRYHISLSSLMFSCALVRNGYHRVSIIICTWYCIYRVACFKKRIKWDFLQFVFISCPSYRAVVAMFYSMIQDSPRFSSVCMNLGGNFTQPRKGWWPVEPPKAFEHVTLTKKYWTKSRFNICLLPLSQLPNMPIEHLVNSTFNFSTFIILTMVL